MWRDRERRQIARVKNSCNVEVMNLRRQLAMKGPLDENKAKKDINRLRDQLKTAQQQLRKNVAKRQDDKEKPAESGRVQDMVKVTGGLQEERRALVEENDRLKQRI